MTMPTPNSCIVAKPYIIRYQQTTKALKKQLNIWCSNVQPTIRPGGTRGRETLLQQTHDGSAATWNGFSLTRNERERADNHVYFI